MLGLPSDVIEQGIEEGCEQWINESSSTGTPPLGDKRFLVPYETEFNGAFLKYMKLRTLRAMFVHPVTRETARVCLLEFERRNTTDTWLMDLAQFALKYRLQNLLYDFELTFAMCCKRMRPGPLNGCRVTYYTCEQRPRENEFSWVFRTILPFAYSVTDVLLVVEDARVLRALWKRSVWPESAILELNPDGEPARVVGREDLIMAWRLLIVLLPTATNSRSFFRRAIPLLRSAFGTMGKTVHILSLDTYREDVIHALSTISADSGVWTIE